MNAADPNETRFTEIIFPAQANHYGTLFGGTALNLMGKAAVIVAARRAGANVVTEHIKGGERQLAMRGTFEMVSVDDDGRPIPVNRMAPEPA